MPSYIRVKQLNQDELTQFFTGAISQQESLLNTIVLSQAMGLTGDQEISGVKTFSNDLVVGNIYSTGVASFDIDEDSSLDISGNSITFDSVGMTGTLQFHPESGIRIYHNNNLNNAPILVTTGNSVFINGNTTFGVYNTYRGESPANINFNMLRNNFSDPVSARMMLPSGLQNNNILNIYFADPNPESLLNDRHAVKVHPYIFCDQKPGGSNFTSKNYIPITGGPYSGKALKKIKYGTIIGNGYQRIILKGSGFWSDTSHFPHGSGRYSPAIIKPKSYQLETFYDINVPSGGGKLRPLKFELPSNKSIQGQVLNLAFHFEADNNPQVVSGFYVGYDSPNGNPIYTGEIFTLTGANYSFSQKERIVCVKQGNRKESLSNDPFNSTNPDYIFNALAQNHIFYYERW
jgi:hypothetical protein